MLELWDDRLLQLRNRIFHRPIVKKSDDMIDWCLMILPIVTLVYQMNPTSFPFARYQFVFGLNILLIASTYFKCISQSVLKYFRTVSVIGVLISYILIIPSIVIVTWEYFLTFIRSFCSLFSLVFMISVQCGIMEGVIAEIREQLESIYIPAMVRIRQLALQVIILWMHYYLCLSWLFLVFLNSRSE